MRHIFIALPLLVLLNLTTQDCSASEAAPQAKKYLSSFEQACTYRGEKIVYLGIGTESRQGRADIFKTDLNDLTSVFEDFTSYAQSYPPFIQDILANDRYKRLCKIILMDPRWETDGYAGSAAATKVPDPSAYQTLIIGGEGLEVRQKNIIGNPTKKESEKFKTMKTYIQTILSNGGVIFIGDFAGPDSYKTELYKSLKRDFPRQVEIFEQEIAVAIINNSINCGAVVRWRTPEQWKRTSVLDNRTEDTPGLKLRVIFNFLEEFSTKIFTKPFSVTVSNLTKKGISEAIITSYHTGPYRFDQSKLSDKELTTSTLDCTVASLVPTRNMPTLVFAIQEKDNQFAIVQPKLPLTPVFDPLDFSLIQTIFERLRNNLLNSEREKLQKKLLKSERSFDGSQASNALAQFNSQLTALTNTLKN